MYGENTGIGKGKGDIGTEEHPGGSGVKATMGQRPNHEGGSKEMGGTRKAGRTAEGRDQDARVDSSLKRGGKKCVEKKPRGGVKLKRVSNLY